MTLSTSTDRRTLPALRSRDFDFELETRGDGRTLEGYAAVFNAPATIRHVDGDFEETILPGAFARSIRDRMPILQWDHGKDPRVGTVPIGAIERLTEDAKGLHVRARLFDNPVVEPVRQAIAAGAVKGMSFRFGVPDGGDTWPTRDRREIRDADVYELGPVAFPAYSGTTVSVRSLLDEAGPRIVQAYACTWDTPTPGTVNDGTPCYQVFRRDSFDDWLATDYVGMPILVNHGMQPDSDERSVVLAEPVGDLLLAAPDDYGLKTWALYRDTWLADATLDAMRQRTLTAYSLHAPIGHSVLVGTHNGLPLYELHGASLRECGPTHRPADPRARVLAVGTTRIDDPRPTSAARDLPVEVFLDQFARVLGAPGLAEWTASEQAHARDAFAAVTEANAERVDALLFEQEMAPYRQAAAAEEYERRTERIVSVLKEARRQANSDYDWWRSQRYRDPRDAAEYRRSYAHARKIEADLLAHLEGDTSRLRRVLAQHRVPVLPSEMDRLRATTGRGTTWR